MAKASVQQLLTCYLFDDGEKHWVSAPTEDAARQVLLDADILDTPNGAEVTVLDPTSILRVHTDDYVYGKFAPETATHYF